MADDTVTATVESRDDAEVGLQSAEFWQAELKAAGKRDDRWLKRSKKIVERYRDEKERKGSSRVNILWANTEILKAALFGGGTHPDVRRRYSDKDPVARVTATMLERGLAYCLDDYVFDNEIDCALEDGLLAGRGYAREVYNPELNEDDEITAQKSVTHFVAYSDLRMSAGRRWPEIWWIAFRHEMTRDQLKELNSELAPKIPLNITTRTEENQASATEDTFKKAEVWEIWDKSRRQRHWVVLGFDTILRSDADPYGLEGFYPGPEPLTMIGTNDSMIPVPPYTLYQDQADELDRVNERITKLIAQLRYRGGYPAGENQDGLLTALMNAEDGDFVPIRNWTSVVEKGGMRGLFQEVDLNMIVTTLEGLYVQRDRILSTIFEITGISDIMRGDVDPNEKLGQSNLKAKFGSFRLNGAERKVTTFIRQLLRIKAELIAENFQPDVLMEVTGIRLPTQLEQQLEQAQFHQFQQAQAQQAQAAQVAQQMGGPPPGPSAPLQPPETGPTIDAVMALLRSDRARSYKIDIETAQTAMPAEEEKKSRLEFASVMQSMLENVVPALVQMPSAAPFVKELVMFTARGFKTGRQLEESLEDALDSVTDTAQQPQPDPEAQAAQAKMQAEQQKMQVEQQKAQADLALRQQEFQFTSQLEERKLAHQVSIDQRKLEQEMILAQTKAQIEAQAQQQDFEFRLGERESNQTFERDKLGVPKDAQQVSQQMIQVQQALVQAVDMLTKMQEATLNAVNADRVVSIERNPKTQRISRAVSRVEDTVH